MNVRPDDHERMTFWVSSEQTKDKEYKVLPLENEGRGICLCPDFATRRQPNLRKGLPAFTRATACKHLEAAALYVCRVTFPEMAKREDRK